MKTAILLAAALLAASVAAVPTASAFRCGGEITCDEIQECEQQVEEGVQTVLVLVGEKCCDFAGC